MDSVSQITLGAAIGEIVLGRKLGNKAMFWGAVGGTIPDLDIITKPFFTEIQSLAFHRGISHSILFAVLFGLGFGWLIHRLYEGQYATSFFRAILSLFISCIPISIIYFIFGNDWHPNVVAALAIVVAGVVYTILSRRSDKMVEVVDDNPSLRSWQWMFFLAFFTHAILDTFTKYGTQLFLPFSNYRAAIASISVADPLFYTIPFIICLVVASRYKRKNTKRRGWAIAGLVLSCTYLLFTLWNKNNVSSVFETQMKEQGITYTRFVTGPTIFNNFLWNMTADSDDAYYIGQYSVFDTSPIEFVRIEKQHDLLANSDNDETINTLRWFSNDYYSVIRRQDGYLQINDMRYGTFMGTGEENDFIFRFVVEAQKDGRYEMLKSLGGPDEEDVDDMFGLLFERIGGR